MDLLSGLMQSLSDPKHKAPSPTMHLAGGMGTQEAHQRSPMFSKKETYVISIPAHECLHTHTEACVASDSY